MALIVLNEVELSTEQIVRNYYSSIPSNVVYQHHNSRSINIYTGVPRPRKRANRLIEPRDNRNAIRLQLNPASSGN